MLERCMLVALSLSQGVDIILAIVFLYLALTARRRFLYFIALSWCLLGLSHLNAIFTVMTTGKVVHGGPVPLIVPSALLALLMANAYTERKTHRGWFVAAAFAFVLAVHAQAHPEYGHFQRSWAPLWFTATAVGWAGVVLWRHGALREWPLGLAAFGYLGAGLNTYTYPFFADTPYGLIGWTIHLVTTACCGLGMLLVHLAERRHALEQEALERHRAERQALKAQRLESLVVLAGGVAHDFNNLLSAMLGHADLALMELPEGSHARNDVERLRDTGRRAFELTRALLAYVGKGEFRQERLGIATVLRDVEGMMRPSFGDRIEVIWEIDEPGFEILADGSQLGRVVMNLMRNACEAMGDEGGRLLVRAGSTVLAEQDMVGLRPREGRKPGRWVCFSVTDEGPGIDESMADRIFDPFFSTKFTGRGLGLASALGIVSRHGGMMGARNPADGGAEFTVYLPVAEEGAVGGTVKDGGMLSESDARLFAEGSSRWQQVEDTAP